MSADIEQLEADLNGLRNAHAAIEAELTHEDMVRHVDEWLAAARARAAGSSKFVLGGAASGETLGLVLYEDTLDDEGLSGRIVGRLEKLGFGKTSAKAKAARLARCDKDIDGPRPSSSRRGGTRRSRRSKRSSLAYEQDRPPVA